MMKLFNLRSCLMALLSLTLLFGALPFEASAQNEGSRTITGIVKDTDGFAVIGAGVIQDKTTNGAITDVDGKYSITVPSDAKSLVFSCIGYKTVVLPLGNKSEINVVMEVEATALEGVSVVAYGVQKKETITGAISSVGTDQLLSSPNASVANALAGQMSGVSTVQKSGQPGHEDPEIFVRGAGSLNNSHPLILVDGVEMSFFQMDPNEIESITVLKDASATAVFGVRGANGVILVTTRRGLEGRPKIQVSSSVGVLRPIRIPEMANSLDYALAYNELYTNDGRTDFAFSDYAIDAFRTNSNPIMYPDTDWNDYMYRDVSIQTQHNVNVSGGTQRVKYFASIGYLYQNGLLKQLPGVDFNSNYKYSRYNFRGNLDIDVTKTTKLKLTIGGVVGDTHEPVSGKYNSGNPFATMAWTQPFSSAGVVDGKALMNDPAYFGNITLVSGLEAFYGTGVQRNIKNTMNMNLELTQDLDVITKGLKLSIKGAYNTNYSFNKKRPCGVETWTPYFISEATNKPVFDPEADGLKDQIGYQIKGKNTNLGYDESNSTGRDWYIEASLRYNRKFKGAHNVSALVLYNQSKKYYPKNFTASPSGYVGFVGRVTYDYKTRYMFEFNVGYNGSENFAPGKRYGLFPAVSAGWILTEESWMKNQKVFDYLKIRATFGMVGNDRMGDERYLYLPDSYVLKQNGYNFGVDNPQNAFKATQQSIGNPDVTWEKALKQNYGIEAKFLKNRLKFTADYFREFRKDILIKRKTVPGILSLGSNLPAVNMGEVRNQGFELELKWNQKVNDFSYFITGNASFARNKILFMDEVEPNYPWMKRTGQQMGLIYGYEAEGFYSDADFNPDGTLVEGLPDPGVPVFPGDVKYKDLSEDGKIDPDDEHVIGFPKRPEWIFGLNFGLKWKGLDFSMNWTGTANRSLQIQGDFRQPFGGNNARGLFQYMLDERWTPETASTATMPRFSQNSNSHNRKTSSMWIRDASYLRLKSVRLGYSFTKGNFLKTLGISNLNIYVSGYNLLTIDGVKIMDPEAGTNKNDNAYPITQTYNFGLVLNF